MGEVADDILSGLQCSWCGVMFEADHGYPVVCEDCWENAKPEQRKTIQKATIPEL